MFEQTLIYTCLAIVLIPIIIFVASQLLLGFLAVITIVLMNDEDNKIINTISNIIGYFQDFNDKLGLIGEKFNRFFTNVNTVLSDRKKVINLLKTFLLRSAIWLIFFMLTFLVVIPYFLSNIQLLDNIILSIVSASISLYVLIGIFVLEFQ